MENLPEEVKSQEVQATFDRNASLFFDVAKFTHCQRVARVFAESTMVPDQFQKNIGNCMIALNLADRMQCDPFMLMQNMYIVHGKPGIESKLAIALINQSGKFTPLQFKLEGNGDGRKCTAHAVHKETKEELSQTVSIQMAKAEGWTLKLGSKWKTMPDLMLQYRSAMFFARTFCPEVLLGMQTREELHDFIDLEKRDDGTYEPPESTQELTERIRGSANGPSFRDQWINLRKPGFSTFVYQHLDDFKNASSEDQGDAREKWIGLYPNKPWPLDPKPIDTANKWVEPTEPPDNTLENMRNGVEEEAEKKILEDLHDQLNIFKRQNSELYKLACFERKDKAAEKGLFPPTIDACQSLLDDCNRLKAESLKM